VLPQSIQRRRSFLSSPIKVRRRDLIEITSARNVELFQVGQSNMKPQLALRVWA